ncbi:MAG: tripartite tricarboxylate transporter substrate-binding protein [Hyphomicrobiales bacterium]
MAAPVLWLAGALAAVAVAPAQAQDFPSRPIRMIVGLPAGGGTDVQARLVSQKLAENMKTTVVVENKPGGNFTLAAKELAAAPADGHTLYFISSSSLITQALHPDYPIDNLKFTPVTEVSTGPMILVARNGLGVKTVGELIDLVKKKPGGIKFGMGGGNGSSMGLATALFQTSTGTSINMVPYRGSAPALNDLLGEHIDVMFDAMPMMSVQAKEGKVTPLAVTGAKRSATLPDVGTMRDAGLKYELTGWYGILAPAGTPPAIVQKIRDEVVKAVAPPEIVKTLASQGMEPRATQPADFAKYMASEFAFYRQIVKDASLKPE